MKIHKFLLPLLALGAMVGCGGSGSKTVVTPTPGTLNIYMGTDSLPGYSTILVSVASVEWSADGSTWNSAGTIGNTFNLAALQNGVGSTAAGALVKGLSLAAGTTIAQFRITWDTTSNPVDPTSAPSYVLTQAVGSQPSVKGILTMPATTVATGHVVIQSGTTTNVKIMFAGPGAIQNTGQVSSSTVASPIYTFQNSRATAFDLAATCTLTGTLESTVTATATPIPGAEVYAETMVNGLATIVRRSMTDANGTFVLDGLAVGDIYYVVSQAYNPANAVTYTPQASAAFQPANAQTYSNPGLSLAFPTTTTAGTLNAFATPASSSTQSTWGEVSQGMATPSTQSPVTAVQQLIIRSTEAVTGSGADTILFPDVPAGVNLIPYTFIGYRTTGAAAAAVNNAGVYTVNSGATTNVSLGF